VLTTNQKGTLAEAKIAALAIELGLGVSRPLDDERYDLILDLRPALVRVQCKWAARVGDVVSARLYTTRRGPEGLRNRRYSVGEFDVFRLVLPRQRAVLPTTGRRRRRVSPSPFAIAPVSEQPIARHSVGPALRVRGYTVEAARAHSSVGRARAWHARGRRFEPAWVHLNYPEVHIDLGRYGRAGWSAYRSVGCASRWPFRSSVMSSEFCG
jgi:PD-(D/E)XK endonuclease